MSNRLFYESSQDKKEKLKKYGKRGLIGTAATGALAGSAAAGHFVPKAIKKYKQMKQDHNVMGLRRTIDKIRRASDE